MMSYERFLLSGIATKSPSCPIVKVKLWHAEYPVLGSHRKVLVCVCATALTLPLTHGRLCFLTCTLFLSHATSFILAIFLIAWAHFVHLPFQLGHYLSTSSPVLTLDLDLWYFTVRWRFTCASRLLEFDKQGKTGLAAPNLATVSFCSNLHSTWLYLL